MTPDLDRLSRARVDVQLAVFEDLVLRNPVTVAVLDRLPALELPDCYLAAGALFQTVWNCLSGRDPQAGIRDYDLLYFDPTDLGWHAEDAVIRRAAELFAGLNADIEVRNEARVHLWYEAKFGVPCRPFTSTAHAIACFPNQSSCFGIRRAGDGVQVVAPYGFADLFALRTRPNPLLAPASVYRAKTERWQREWPELTVLPWPERPS